MKKALIFQSKLIEIAATAFPVSPEMEWIDVADDIILETHEYLDGAIVASEIPVLTYRELRAAAYPPVVDQLDAIWKGFEAEAAMLQIILAVKAEYPKP